MYLEFIPSPIITVFDWAYWLWDFTHHEKYQEIIGISQQLDDPIITTSKAVLINTLYELESWCTSIIAKQADGTIIHGRNLDFDFASYMRTITHRARFMKNGKEVFESVMFAGTVGIYTGIKKGAFSISENQRAFTDRESGLVANLVMVFSGYTEISWLVRDVLTECFTYDCAHERLVSNPISAYGYLILAGSKDDEGVVITRDRFGEAHIDSLNATEGKWFIVQTNNDHWDTGCYNRCAAATERLIQLGQENISHSVMREHVMFLFPTENHDTIYNSAMVARDGLIDSVFLDYSENQGIVQTSRYLYDRPFSMGARIRALNEVWNKWFY